LQIVRQPFYTDKLTINLRDNVLYCVYFNDLNLVVAAFTLQCSEAKSWHDAITKAKHIYSRLKLGSSWDSYTIKYTNTDMLGVKKSPINSSIGSRVSSLNNSHSGSVELNESKAVSVDFEKANSVSSDEGMAFGVALKTKLTPSNSKKLKPITSNSLTVQPFSGLGQSMPNLNIPGSSNTLLVPGTSKTHSHSHSGQSNLLSPSQRGISYPPPSPTR
jgi:pleckstrin homology domain-containing family G member 5